MSIDQLTNLLVTIALIELMLAVGMSVRLAELGGVARDWGLGVRAILANYVIVPAITVGLLLLLSVRPMVAAGFIILAGCPGAPFGPPFTGIARGNVVVSVGLMVLLAGSSAIVAPILLTVLLARLHSEQPLTIDSAKVTITLLVTQLVPLSAGIALRHWRPTVAERLLKPANALSKVLNLGVVILILAVQYRSLAQITPRALGGMLSLLVASFAAGYLLSGRDQATRRAMTLTTSLRNAGVGLVIATGSFAGTAAVTAVLLYGVVEIAGSLLLALWWRSRPPALHEGQGV